MDKECITINVTVDTTEVDLAIEKLNKVHEIINKISEASEGLKYLNNISDRMVKMSCEQKKYWFEDLKRIADIMQPNYDKYKGINNEDNL